MLVREAIYLRTLEPGDVTSIYQWENEQENWEVSNTTSPFSLAEIENFVKGSQDIKKVRQLRFMICLNASKESIGCIDLFDYDSDNDRVGVGILIAEHKHRRKGYGKQALDAVIEYCAKTLSLHQIYCNILDDNAVSITLFKGAGFKLIGVKRDWVNTKEGRKDEGMYQLLLAKRDG